MEAGFTWLVLLEVPDSLLVPAGIGDGIGAGALARFCNSEARRREPAVALFWLRNDNVRTKPRKIVAVYFVIFVRALPEPAPKSASVAPPPKATPAPASFFGNWIRMSSISNAVFTTKMIDNRI